MINSDNWSNKEKERFVEIGKILPMTKNFDAFTEFMLNHGTISILKVTFFQLLQTVMMQIMFTTQENMIFYSRKLQ